MEILFQDDSIAYCEAMGLSKCFQAYAENCSSELIFEIGFNKNTGYVYIALENGITICSMLGRGVDFMTFTDHEEIFYADYDEAINSLK